jgi:hypothetical protein
LTDRKSSKTRSVATKKEVLLPNNKKQASIESSFNVLKLLFGFLTESCKKHEAEFKIQKTL